MTGLVDALTAAATPAGTPVGLGPTPAWTLGPRLGEKFQDSPLSFGYIVVELQAKFQLDRFTRRPRYGCQQVQQQQ